MYWYGFIHCNWHTIQIHKTLKMVTVGGNQKSLYSADFFFITLNLLFKKKSIILKEKSKQRRLLWGKHPSFMWYPVLTSLSGPLSPFVSTQPPPPLNLLPVSSLLSCQFWSHPFNIHVFPDVLEAQILESLLSRVLAAVTISQSVYLALPSDLSWPHCLCIFWLLLTLDTLNLDTVP